MWRPIRFLLRWGARAFVVLLGLGVVVYLAFNLVPAIGTPSPDAVRESVADETGAIADELVGDYGCTRLRAPRTWRCDFADPGHSSTATYRVVMRGRDCWDARRLSGPHWDGPDPPPARASGCVKLGNQL